jgi:WD40 repeat protein
VTYDLESSSPESIKVWSTGHVGHASLALSSGETVLAVGGWDGHVRLFSAATGKPLGDLDYHRESVHIVAFANASASIGVDETEVESTIELGDEDEDSDVDDVGGGGQALRERWLVSGSKDRRIAMWELKDFGQAKKSI